MRDSRTQQRLLETAGECFAERGFRGATVREICRRARANVAAVNYHFRGKVALYSAVLQYAHVRSVEKYPPGAAVAREKTPERRLAAFVRAFLLRILDEGRPAWHGKLMAQELIAPTRALDALVRKGFKPQMDLLESLVKPLLGRRAAPTRVRLCAQSIIAQCLFYRHCREAIVRLDPRQGLGSADVEALADHIARFSIAALRGMA